MTIVEFLEARIAEDEADARTADEGRLLTWSKNDHMVINDSGFMQTFTPSRILREVAVKRAVLKAHCRIALHTGGGAKYYETRRVCRSCEPLRGLNDCWPCPTVLHLAAVHSDHPDFDESWRA